MAHLSFHAGTAGKLKRSELVRANCHTFRKSRGRFKNHGNEDIDNDRTKFNLDYEFHGKPIEDIVEERLENEYRGKRAIRKDAVVVREIIASPSADVFEGMTIVEKQAKMEQFVKDALPWFNKEFGKANVLGASAHLDETNPHTHFAIMPMTKDGRLSQKDFFKGPADLKRQHKEFRTHMVKKGWVFDLDNKYEDVDEVDLPTYKANAKKIEKARREQTDAIRELRNDKDLRKEALEMVVSELHGMNAAELRRMLLEDERNELKEDKKAVAEKFFNAEKKEQQANEKLAIVEQMVALSQNEKERNTVKLPSTRELREIMEKETDGQFSVYVTKRTKENVLVDLRGSETRAISESELIRELTTVETDNKGSTYLDLKGNKAISYVLGYYSSKTPKRQEQAHLDGLEVIAKEQRQMALEMEKERLR